MVATPRNLDSIFDAVVAIEDVDERARYLDEHCHDPHMRREIEKLLKAHDNPRSLFNQPPPSFAATVQHGATPSNRLSVLKAIGEAFGVNAKVSLHDAAEVTEEPVQQLSSDAIPRSEPESRYQLFGEIARGGMGAILKGRDTDLGRDLAVKVLLDSHKEKPEVIQRFVEEAQIGGQLQHPGIAPVYELGQFADQRPYFTMKLVKGKTLAALLSARKRVETDRIKLVGIFEQVCQTMAYAHSRSVIHRDLKPANIMVGAFGEVQVMDWGLAKVLSAGGVADEKKACETRPDHSIIETLRSSGSETPIGLGSHTQMGSVMGTPAYMPPEQALGEIDQLDQRCDVFGLGAILCEILTGEPPYVAEDTVNVFRLATRGKLDECFERLDSCTADEDLVALAKECLSGEREGRPRDAGVLADRLSEHQAAVATRLRESEIDLAAQTVRADEERKRRRVSMALAVSVLALVISISGGGLWLQAKETAAAKQETVQQQELAAAANQLADEEKEKAHIEKVAKEELRWVLYQSDIQRAQAEIARGNFSLARKKLLSQLPEEGQRDIRGFEWHYLYRKCPTPVQRQEFQWAEDVPRLPENTLDALPTIDRDGRRITGTVLEDTKNFFQAISRDGRRIAAIRTEDDAKSHRLTVWSTENGKRVWEVKISSPIRKPIIRLNSDGSKVGLLTSRLHPRHRNNAPLELHVWDTVANEQIAKITPLELPGFGDHPTGFNFRPKSSSVAIYMRKQSAKTPPSRSSTLVMWDYAMGKQIFEFHYGRFEMSFFLNPVEFSPDGSLLAMLTRPNDKNYEPAWEDWKDSVGVVHIIDAETGKPRKDLFSLPFCFADSMPFPLSTKFSFSPNGTWLAMAAAEQSFDDGHHERSDRLFIWHVPSGALTAAVPTRSGLGNIKFSRSGNFLVLYNEDYVNKPEVFRVLDGSRVMTVDNFNGGIVHFSEDEKSVQTINREGKLYRWPMPSTRFDHAEYARYGDVSLSGNGRLLARAPWRGGREDELSIFDLDGRHVRSSKIPKTQRRQPSMLNHDGSLLAIQRVENARSESAVSTLVVWDLHKEALLGELFRSGETERLGPWASSPTDSKLAGVVKLAVQEQDQWKDQLRIWNQRTLKEQCIDMPEPATAVAFSCDGALIGVSTLSRTSDSSEPSNGRQIGTLRLYDSETGVASKSFSIPGKIDQIAFSPDGRLVALRNIGPQKKSRVDIWNLQSGNRHAVIDETTHKMVFTSGGDRLITAKVLPGAGRPTNQISIWDPTSGDRLLRRSYFASSADVWMEFRMIRGQHQLLVGMPYGPPKIWDGRPVNVDNY